jgi:acetyltransferase-like isoleucine patch superfamily enzyme
MNLEPARYRLRRIFTRPLSVVMNAARSLAEQADFLDLVDEGVVSVGRGSQVCPRVYVYRDPGGAVRGGHVHIGSFCSIGPKVEIFTGGNHRTDWVSTYQFRIQQDLPGAWLDGAPATKGDVTIGNDVWIGMGATILSGVTIGDGAVVAARAVVSRKVRPYAVVAGNPAREVRRRFTDDQVDRLQRIGWWNWQWTRIQEELPYLCSENIDDFLARWESSVDGQHR